MILIRAFKGLALFLLFSFSGVNSSIKSKLPKPEDFSQALYTFDIGQNDLDFAFKSMTEKQIVESFPRTVNQFYDAVKVTEIYSYTIYKFWVPYNSF